MRLGVYPWIDWTAAGVILALVTSIIGIFLPSIHRRLYRPELSLKLIGPSHDNGNQYWHIEITNKGSTAKNVGVFCTGFRSSPEDAEFNFLPRVRFQWPYEDSNRSPVDRDISQIDHSDFFSTENSGKIHLVFCPTKLPFPSTIGAQLTLRISAFAEHYRSMDLIVTIKKTDAGWDIT